MEPAQGARPMRCRGVRGGAALRSSKGVGGEEYPEKPAPRGNRWQWKQSSGLGGALTSTRDGGVDAQRGLGAVAGEGTPGRRK